MAVVIRHARVMPISLSPARAVALRCEQLVNPVGLDETRPRFSWQMADSRAGARQSACEIAVASDDALAPEQADLWRSGRLEGDQTHLVPYAGRRLRPGARHVWRVRLWDRDGKVSAWSEPATFTTGFLGTAWPARWIGWRHGDRRASTPVRYLRHTFDLEEKPAAARLHITALGLYEAHLNGGKVGHDVLTPGWTDYRRRTEYLTYDVTDRLAAGRNALGILLADGWYCGRLGWHGQRRLYGPTPAVLAALRLTLADGSERFIGTDRDWKVATGAFIAADLYDGETCDARLEPAGWTTPDFDDRDWRSAQRLALPALSIDAKHTPPVRAVETLPALARSEPAAGLHIFDFGQNLVGVARLALTAPAGACVTLRHGEMLNADGTLHTANLRGAEATDRYICRGRGREIYQPRFTFHGFRYIEISGLPAAPARDDITAVVLQSDLPPTGVFSCSDPLLDKLQSNIRWGQRGNSIDLPTDCPQRDERLGWTGDAQIFVRTAAFNYDIATFFRKWLRDLRDGQRANGSFPDVAPDAIAVAMRDNPRAWTGHRHDGNAAWADAGVVCPWIVYQHYGDARMLAENYPAMLKWISHQERTSRALLRPATAYGDWLATDAVTPARAPTPNDLVGTACFARSTALTARVAQELGRRADARRLAALHRRIVAAFRKEYVTASGRLVGDTQTGYLLALAFDLLPPAQRPGAVERLARLIEDNGNRLSTGFVGTPLLCPVLSRFGRDDIAHRLIRQRAYPSWLYPVLNGATTMWERWNSWTHETGFGDAGMNSFNHYAYGAVGEWMYATIAGLADDPAQPAFKRLHLRPAPSRALRHASAELITPHGRARSAWRRLGQRWIWEIEVAANTSARAWLPTTRKSDVTIVSARDGVRFVTETGAGRVQLELAAGRHRIEVRRPILIDT